MTREEAISVLHKIKPTMHRADGKSTTHILETIALDMAIKALEQEPCDDIKEYYKDIWDCDINHPRYEDKVAEIVEKSYMSGYVQGVKNTEKEFRFELEQEPCEDAISRSETIKYLNTNMAWYDEDGEMADSDEKLKAITDLINGVPSVTPPHKKEEWIPCSERLPEEHEWVGTKKFGTTISDEVYVTFENPEGERFTKHLSFQNGKLSSFDQRKIDAFCNGSVPIAWMPLPEPYNAEMENEKVCNGCYYDDGEVHAECVVCDKAKKMP